MSKFIISATRKDETNKVYYYAGMDKCGELDWSFKKHEACSFDRDEAEIFINCLSKKYGNGDVTPIIEPIEGGSFENVCVDDIMRMITKH